VSLIDELNDVSGDGGSSPRPRRGLSESMIAGRRRPGEPKPAPAASEDQPKPTVRRRRSSASAPDETPAEETAPRPARAPRASRAAAPAAPAAETETEEKPRRTRAPRTRRPAAAAEAATPDETPIDLVAPEEMPEAPAAPAITIAPLPPLPAAEPVPADLVGLSTEVGRLRSLIEQQRTVLAELRAGMLTLGQQVDRGGYRPRLGIFVDVPNLMYGVEGGRPVHMGRLLNMLREGRQLVRATAYSPISDDPREPIEHQKFVAPFVPYDYRIVTKSLKRFADGSIKGNFDVEMAIDMVSMADRVDVIAIVSGDADFARAVEAVQNRGVRVEVVAFSGSTSLEMRALADHYLELGTVVNQIT
jgi:uncharacterized LabA/DUF88 family protein